MLVRNFNLIDIKRYEERTGSNIINYFNDIKFSNLIELIQLGNGNCDEELAGDILDIYLRNNTLIDAMLEIKKQLLGLGSDSEDVSEGEKIDITEYDSLTDLYITFSMQLMSVGLQYNEFWSMSTKEMYKVFNSIVIKMQNDTNRELNNYHTLAAMVGGAVWGKLQKEPPKVELVKDRSTEVEGLDVEDAILIAKLKAIGNINKK